LYAKYATAAAIFSGRPGRFMSETDETLPIEQARSAALRYRQSVGEPLRNLR